MGCEEAPWPYWARRTKSLKAHVAREGKKKEGVLGIGLDLESKSSPLSCALGLGGSVSHAPPPIYRGEGAPQEDIPSPWRPSLSLSPVSP